MKAAVMCILMSLVMLTGSVPALATDFRDKVKVEVESAGLQPGMDPGMYVCAAGHLHIKGTVQNLAGVALGQIKVAGKAFGPDGSVLGTATSSTRQPSLAPNEKAEIDLEFLTITGPKIQQVKKHEITVVEAPSK